MFGFFQFIYFTNRSVDEFKENILPDLTCFDIKKCPSLTNVIINITLINGLTCTPTSIFTFYDQTSNLFQLILSFNKIIEECLTKGIDISCNNSTHFHCDQSLRCISYHRVQDGYLDCSFNEDESFSACSWNDSSRYQCSKENYSCLSPVAISNSVPDCKNGEDEEIYHKQDFDETTPYSKFCLGLAQQYIFDDTYNDLLHCELWPCDSPYVHCDQIWDCPNGVDELNCPDTNCSSNAHECYDSSLRSTYCLSAAQIVDEIKSDCDRLSNRQLYYINGNTINENEYYLWNKTKCLYANNICLSASLPLTTGDDDVCVYERKIPKMKNRQSVMILGTERQLCHLKIDTMQKRKESFLNAFRLGSFPEVTSLLSVKYISRINEEKTLQSSININISQTLFCHRGILILSGNNQTKTCLCPPSYFGSQCQWQNQRISLTFQLIPPQTTFISAIFQIIIMLIDRQGNKTDQYEQIVYSPSRDCRTKFHLYLLYPQRTKSHLNNYSIHIDLFNKMTLKHWTSWFIPIPFQFLPVNRISTKLIIPNERLKRPCLLLCGLHGQCMQYTNNQSKYFCLCDQKYSGSFCNESYQCQCSEDSFCLTSNICICPLDRFGSKCYLKRSICSLTNNPCKNDGICIPTDDRINLHGYSCFCKENYFGLHCEVNSYRVSVKLDEAITRSSSFVFIHFITIFQHAKHERTTILKKIPIDSDTIIFYTSKQFNIAFVQLVNQSYYLLIVRETFLLLENIHGKVLSKQTCPYVKYFLNSTILKYETFYHPKYYPFVCRQYLHLMCFYDETLMCVCDLDRFANCFAFNHTLDNTCEGHNDCQNDGQCFQNNQTCPTMSICACKDCYYGGKCQMSNEGNLLSLDPIIGYYIKPNVAFYDQPFIIKVTMMSRSRSNIQKNKPYYQHLQEQLKRHKHLLISPLALVLLGTPRLAFSFVSGCMRTPRDSWFYVIGYYFSFIPPILTFSAFVLPSDNYRKVFQNAIQQQIIRFRSTFLSKF
ncbi:hypothetical protein I4U23_021619 [Adineta vaga]|nr:hypothetical protein I4U23_021619 [Adineta vaga]